MARAATIDTAVNKALPRRGGSISSVSRSIRSESSGRSAELIMSCRHPRRLVWTYRTHRFFQCARSSTTRRGRERKSKIVKSETCLPILRCPRRADAFCQSCTGRDCQPHGSMSRPTSSLGCRFAPVPCLTQAGCAPANALDKPTEKAAQVPAPPPAPQRWSSGITEACKEG